MEEWYTRKAAKKKFETLYKLCDMWGNDDAKKDFEKVFPLYWKVLKAYRDAIIEAAKEGDVTLGHLCYALTSLSYPHENHFMLAELLREAKIENSVTRFDDNWKDYRNGRGKYKELAEQIRNGKKLGDV